MNDGDLRAGLVGGFVIGGLSVMLLMALCFPDDREVFEAEAVEAGHAEYYLDENHDRQWRWKDL